MKVRSALFHAGSGSSWAFARLSDMGRILLIAFLLVLTVSDADARRRHHHRWQGAPVMMMPGVPMDMPRDLSRREMRALTMRRHAAQRCLHPGRLDAAAGGSEFLRPPLHGAGRLGLARALSGAGREG